MQIILNYTLRLFSFNDYMNDYLKNVSSFIINEKMNSVELSLFR